MKALIATLGVAVTGATVGAIVASTRKHEATFEMPDIKGRDMRYETEYTLMSTMTGSGNAGDRYGHMSASGNTILVGGPSAENKGIVYVHTCAATCEENNVILKGQMESEHFGLSSAVSEDGSILVVGSPSHGKELSGYVSIYKRHLDTWKLSQRLNGVKGEDERFGIICSISPSGTTIAIGTEKERVYVFKQMIGSGQYSRSKIIKKKALAIAVRDDFIAVSAERGVFIFRGRDVSILGKSGTSFATTDDTIVLGYPEENDHQGTVVVYHASGAQHQLMKVDDLDGMQFGKSVSISKDSQYIAVGAPGHDVVYVYRRRTEGYVYDLIYRDSRKLIEEFGSCVHITPDSLYVSSYSSATEPDTGCVYVYRRDTRVPKRDAEKVP